MLTVPNLSLRMSEITAAVTRPLLRSLPERVIEYNRRYQMVREERARVFAFPALVWFSFAWLASRMHGVLCSLDCELTLLLLWQRTLEQRGQSAFEMTLTYKKTDSTKIT